LKEFPSHLPLLRIYRLFDEQQKQEGEKERKEAEINLLSRRIKGYSLLCAPQSPSKEEQRNLFLDKMDIDPSKPVLKIPTEHAKLIFSDEDSKALLLNEKEAGRMAREDYFGLAAKYLDLRTNYCSLEQKRQVAKILLRSQRA
jgi:hypothetical protein